MSTLHTHNHKTEKGFPREDRRRYGAPQRRCVGSAPPLALQSGGNRPISPLRTPWRCTYQRSPAHTHHANAIAQTDSSKTRAHAYTRNAHSHVIHKNTDNTHKQNYACTHQCSPWRAEAAIANLIGPRISSRGDVRRTTTASGPYHMVSTAHRHRLLGTHIDKTATIFPDKQNTT